MRRYKTCIREVTERACSMTSSSLTLIELNAGDASERDWIRFLLSDFRLEVIRAPDFSVIRPGALYSIYNHRRLSLPADFLEKISGADGCGLLHLGDERFSGDFRIYGSFSYVIRNSAAAHLEGPGLLNVPIGYSIDLPDLPFIPASRRRYLWSFAGGRRPWRTAMAACFADIDPHLLSLPDTQKGETHISRGEYCSAMADSVFVPCGEGNVTLETVRPYEALEYGAIPLLPRRALADMYRTALGPHPLPSFSSWKEAAAFVRTLRADPSRLDRLQQETQEWWRERKSAWPKAVSGFIGRHAAGEGRPGLKQRFGDWNNGLYQPRRMTELLRQQSIGQVAGRLVRLASSAGRRQPQNAGVWGLSSPPSAQPEAEKPVLPVRRG